MVPLAFYGCVSTFICGVVPKFWQAFVIQEVNSMWKQLILFLEVK